MAKTCSPVAWLLLALCLVACPLLALQLDSTSAIDPEPTQPTTNLTHTSTFSTTVSTGRILLTRRQLKELQEIPANAFLPQGSTHLTLDYDSPGTAGEAEGALWAIEHLEELQLRQRIHRIPVDGWGSLTNFTTLASGLSRIVHLEELHWCNNDPIPQQILSVLKDFRPSCKLMYAMKFSNWDPYQDDYVPIQGSGEEPHRDVRSKTRSLVLGSPNLYQLSTYVRYGRYDDPESLRLIHQILTSCPNLRYVDLAIGHEGCVVGNDQPYAFDFSGNSTLAKGSFAPLESLRLSRYRLDARYNGDYWSRSSYGPDRSRLKWPWHYFPDLILQNLPPPWWDFMYKEYVHPQKPGCPTEFNETTNLDGWIERMDFSKLNSLDLPGVSPASLHKLQPVLTNLTSLAIHGGGNCTAGALEHFLDNGTKRLRKLHLCNIYFTSFNNLLNILSKRGQSLTLVTLYESEDSREHSCWNSDEDRDHPNCAGDYEHWNTWYDDHLYLNTSQLRQLQQSSPAIEILDIDMDRNLDTNAQNELFKTLGCFPHLSNLTLRLESPTFQAIRDGTCGDRWQSRHFAKDLHDPVINGTWVKNIFHSIRLAQTKHSDPATGTRSPALTMLEVTVGAWARRNQHGMSMPDKFVLGRFECNAAPAPEGFESLNGDIGECTGHLQWPREHMWNSGLEYPDFYEAYYPMDDFL